MFHFAELQQSERVAWRPEAFYPQLGIRSRLHELGGLKVEKLFDYCIFYRVGLVVVEWTWVGLTLI